MSGVVNFFKWVSDKLDNFQSKYIDGKSLWIIPWYFMRGFVGGIIDVAFGVGIALTAAGFWLMLTDNKNTTEETE